MSADSMTQGIIRELLSKAFSNNEINTLAFDLFPDIYGDFSNSMSKGEKILAIVEYANNRGKLEPLLDYVKEKNLHQYNQYIGKTHTLNSANAIPNPPPKEKNISEQPQVAPTTPVTEVSKSESPVTNQLPQPASSDPNIGLLLITVVIALVVTGGVAWILDAILALSGNVFAFVVVLAIVFAFVLVVIGKVTGADFIKLLTESINSSK